MYFHHFPVLCHQVISTFSGAHVLLTFPSMLIFWKCPSHPSLIPTPAELWLSWVCFSMPRQCLFLQGSPPLLPQPVYLPFACDLVRSSPFSHAGLLPCLLSFLQIRTDCSCDSASSPGPFRSVFFGTLHKCLLS